MAAGEFWSDSGMVFATQVGTPVDPDNFSRSWSRLRMVLGESAVRFYDLRHTCVRLLLDSGVPPHVVRDVVGHGALDVTLNIYAHVSLDEKRTALGKFASGSPEEGVATARPSRVSERGVMLTNALVGEVVRGGFDPPTLRFSGASEPSGRDR